MNWICITLALLLPPALPQKETSKTPAQEYRLLSVSDTEKMILISDPIAKTRYLLDASNAKILIEGKESDLKQLLNYSSAQVVFEKKNLAHEGITLDGVAKRIEVNKKK